MRTALSGVARHPLGPDEWAKVAAAVDRLFESPELQPTLEGVVDVLLAYADRVVVSLLDDRNVLKIAASGAHEPEARRYLALRLHERDTGQLLMAGMPLRHHGSEFGRLYLDGSAPGPLLDAVTERCAQALYNARRFERERHVAVAFQAAALASELPKRDPFQFSAVYVAGRSEALVGGDWYDAFPLTDGRVMISIGDVEGSGLEAALTMVQIRQTIRALAQLQPDPGVILAGANSALWTQHPERYATAFVGILDPVTQRCTYANAGHPPPMVLQRGRVDFARGRDLPIGLEQNQVPEIHEVEVSDGAVLLLYTDGLTEATRDVVSGEASVEAALASIDPATTENVAAAVYGRVLVGHAVDDVAILAVTIGKLPPISRWKFDPRYVDLADRFRAALREEIGRHAFTPERIADVETAVSELLANAIRHAPGSLEVLIETRPEALALHVIDRGPGYSPTGSLPNDLFSEYGRGLFLVGQLSDAFIVERRPGTGSHALVVFSHDRKDGHERSE